jgi:hypothetical protein
MRHKSGTVLQGALAHREGDYNHEFITTPVLGIVLSTYCSDDPLNMLAGVFQDGRGYACQARVLIVNDGTQQPCILPNVIVTPGSGTGFDDYSEEIPRGVTGKVDGTEYKTGLQDVPLNQLDGDWCIVNFIGGSVHQPYISTWFPHPANRRDATTSNLGESVTLEQGHRWVKRFQGTRVAITSKGDIVVDTNEANQPIEPRADSFKRTKNAEGGDIYVNVKEARTFEMNFNPSVKDVNLPDVLRSPREVEELRRVDLTSLLANKDAIRLIAGQVMELFSYSMLHLGTEADATENFVLGQSWKTLMETVLQDLIDHVHPTGVGPSGTSPTLTASFVPLKASLDDQLSDWIFGQKAAPTL